MLWQDWIFMVGGFIFSIALIPTIRDKDKPSVKTSLLTAGVLTAYLICYATLGLWLGFTSGVLTTGAWFLLAYQKWNKE